MRILGKRMRPRLLFMYGVAVLLVVTARPTLGTLLTGLAPIALGEGLRLWATGYLHKTESLTVAGPYAYLRHPLYLGTMLIATGFALMAASPGAFLVYVLFLIGYFTYYMPYKNRIEGARLESLFGDDYRRYAVAVPSLVPRLHAYVPLGAADVDSPRWRGVRFEDNNETRVAAAVSSGIAVMIGRWLLI